MPRRVTKPVSPTDRASEAPIHKHSLFPTTPSPCSPKLAKTTSNPIKDTEHRAVYLFSTLSKNYMSLRECN